jgi:hypothetical protein
MKLKGHHFDTVEVIRVMLASRPKVSFDMMAAPVPEIMDYAFVLY